MRARLPTPHAHVLTHQLPDALTLFKTASHFNACGHVSAGPDPDPTLISLLPPLYTLYNDPFGCTKTCAGQIVDKASLTTTVGAKPRQLSPSSTILLLTFFLPLGWLLQHPGIRR